MDATSHAPAATPSRAADSTVGGRAPDRLGAEVRESALLLVLSVAVTAGIAGGAQALLVLFG